MIMTLIWTTVALAGVVTGQVLSMIVKMERWKRRCRGFASFLPSMVIIQLPLQPSSRLWTKPSR